MTLTMQYVVLMHKSYLGRYVHNFSMLPIVVLLMLRCKILAKVGSYLPVKILLSLSSLFLLNARVGIDSKISDAAGNYTASKFL